MEIDNIIMVILVCLREGIARIYIQKLNELDKETDIQDWNKFIKELKMTFSDKNKAADTKWKIKTFKQEKKHIADFIIEFKALVMKADIDELHAIFLLKKNVQTDIIKTILEYLLMAAFKEWKIAFTLVRQRYESIEGRQDY